MWRSLGMAEIETLEGEGWNCFNSRLINNSLFCQIFGKEKFSTSYKWQIIEMYSTKRNYGIWDRDFELRPTLFRMMEIDEESWFLHWEGEGGGGGWWLYEELKGMQNVNSKKVSCSVIPQPPLPYFPSLPSPIKLNYFILLFLVNKLTYLGGVISVSLSGNLTRASSSSNLAWATVSCSSWCNKIQRLNGMSWADWHYNEALNTCCLMP